MSYSRWGGSNWYAYDGGDAFYAHFAQGGFYSFTEHDLRDNIDGCLAQIKDGNHEDREELREYMAEYLEEQ